MSAVALIQITVDEKGAVTALNNVTSEVEKMGPALQSSGAQGNVVMKNLSTQTYQAHDAAMLLGRTLGVQLPRQLDTFLAKSQTVAPILAQAFNVAIFAGFAGAAISALSRLPGFIDDIVESMTHAKARAAEMEEAIKSLDAAQRDLNLAQRDYADKLRLSGLAGSQLLEAEMALKRGRLADQQAAVAGMEALRAQLVKTAAETVTVASEMGNSWEVPTQGAKEAQVQIVELDKKIAVLNTGVAIQSSALLDVDAALKKAYGQENKDMIAKTAEAIDSIHFIDKPSIPSLLRPGEGLDAQANMDQLDKAWEESLKRRGEMTGEAMRVEAEANQAQKRAYDENLRQQEQAARSFAQMRRDLAQGIAGFFDDITTGNIGRRFRRMFEQLIAGMVADWILGVQQMGAVSSAGMGGAGGAGIAGMASNAGGGGGLRGILGGIFGPGGFSGGGFSHGPGATPPFFEGAGGMSGLPLSAGGAITSSTAMPAGSSMGGAMQSAGGSGIFSRLGGAAGGLMQLMGGAQLAKLIGFGSPVRGAIAGGVGTALGLSAIAAIAPAVLGTAIGGLFGPIGIGIGAAVGALIGVLGNGKRASQRHDLQMQMFQQLGLVEDQFKFGGADYGSTRSSLEQMRQDYAKQFSTLKGKEAEFVDPHINFEIQKIDLIQAERQRRAALMFGPAQFRTGGFVGPLGVPLLFASGGEVPAILHAGEFVMRPEAVRQQGVGKLQRMNDGGGGGDTFHVQISAVDARGFDEYMRRGGLAIIRRNIALARTEGRW
jgi:hypothetical protein